MRWWHIEERKKRFDYIAKEFLRKESIWFSNALNKWINPLDHHTRTFLSAKFAIPASALMSKVSQLVFLRHSHHLHLARAWWKRCSHQNNNNKPKTLTPMWIRYRIQLWKWNVCMCCTREKCTSAFTLKSKKNTNSLCVCVCLLVCVCVCVCVWFNTLT